MCGFCGGLCPSRPAPPAGLDLAHLAAPAPSPDTLADSPDHPGAHAPFPLPCPRHDHAGFTGRHGDRSGFPRRHARPRIGDGRVGAESAGSSFPPGGDSLHRPGGLSPPPVAGAAEGGWLPLVEGRAGRQPGPRRLGSRALPAGRAITGAQRVSRNAVPAIGADGLWMTHFFIRGLPRPPKAIQ